MIAVTIVRIAPLERWCNRPREYAEINPAMKQLPGLPITIHLQGVAVSPQCNGKWWEVEKESFTKLYRLVHGEDDFSSDEPFVCEHMLEMD